jgi:hypothetical protein
VNIGDKVKLKLRFLADQDPNYFAGVQASDARSDVRPGTNIPDLRAWVFTKRFRLDGTAYISRTEESLNFMPGRDDVVPGLDVDEETGEILTLRHLEAIWERDLDAYNRGQNVISPVQRRTQVAIPNIVTAPAPATGNMADLLAQITANPEAMAALKALLGGAEAPAPTKAKAPAKAKIVTPVDAEIDQLPF